MLRSKSAVLIGLVVFSTLALFHCATLDQILQKPEVKFNRLSLAETSLLQGKFNFNFLVSNPNPINIRAGRITYHLKFNGRSFIRGKLDRGITLPGNGSAEMIIPVQVRYLDVFDSMMEMMRRKNAAYDLSGSLRVGPMTIPYQARGTFDLPQMPKIYLDGIGVEQISLLGARLSSRLTLENPNDFALAIDALQYTLVLDGMDFTKARLTPETPVGANAKTSFTMAFDVSFATLGRSAYRLLMGNTTNYDLQGRLIVPEGDKQNRSLPFHLGGRVPIRNN